MCLGQPGYLVADAARVLDSIGNAPEHSIGPALYVDALSKAGGPAGSYLKLMRHNVTQLLAGMKQN